MKTAVRVISVTNNRVVGRFSVSGLGFQLRSVVEYEKKLPAFSTFDKHVCNIRESARIAGYRTFPIVSSVAP